MRNYNQQSYKKGKKKSNAWKYVVVLLLILIPIIVAVGVGFLLNKKLATPIISFDYNKDVISWAPVDKAEKYHIKVEYNNGDKYVLEDDIDVDSNSFILRKEYPSGEYRVTLTAKGKGFPHRDSAPQIKTVFKAEEMKKVGIREVVTQKDGKKRFIFDGEGVSVYDIFIISIFRDNELIEEKILNIEKLLEFTYTVSQSGRYIFKINAKKSNKRVKDSIPDDIDIEVDDYKNSKNRVSATISRKEFDKKDNNDFTIELDDITDIQSMSVYFIFSGIKQFPIGQVKDISSKVISLIDVQEKIKNIPVGECEILVTVKKRTKSGFESFGATVKFGTSEIDKIIIGDSRVPEEFSSAENYVINSEVLDLEHRTYAHKIIKLSVWLEDKDEDEIVPEKKLTMDVDYSILPINADIYRIRFKNNFSKIFSGEIQADQIIKLKVISEYKGKEVVRVMKYYVIDSASKIVPENDVYYVPYSNVGSEIKVNLLKWDYKGDYNSNFDGVLESIKDPVKQDLIAKKYIRQEGNTLVIDKEYIKRFDPGAVVVLKGYLKKDLPADFQFELRILPEEHKLLKAEQHICKTDGNREVVIKYDDQDADHNIIALSVDGIEYSEYKSPYFKYDKTAKKITLTKDLIQSLSQGKHRIGIAYRYFDTGRMISLEYATFFSLINTKDIIENVKLNRHIYSSDYPKYKISFEVLNKHTKFQVFVNSRREEVEIKQERELDKERNEYSFEIDNIEHDTLYNIKIQSFTTPSVKYEYNFKSHSENVDKYLEQKYESLNRHMSLYLETDEDIEAFTYHFYLYGSLRNPSAYARTGIFKYDYDENKKIQKAEVDLYCEFGWTEFSNKMGDFIKNRFQEAYSMGYSTPPFGAKNKEIRLWHTFNSTHEPDWPDWRVTTLPKQKESSKNYIDTNNHYSKTGRSSNYNGFKINTKPETLEVVEIVDEMVMLMQLGLKPRFVAGSRAERIYKKAEDVLRKIIDDEMTDYEKTLAIYEWIVYNTRYDYQAADEAAKLKGTEYNKLYSHKSFYAEGVFEDGIAVCNGFAKAFVILGSIEGLEVIKVDGLGDAGSGGGHAWNKVKIGDYWYVVDSTWGNSVFNTIAGEREFLNRQNIFLSDIEVEKGVYYKNKFGQQRIKDPKKGYEKEVYKRRAYDSIYHSYANIFIANNDGDICDKYMYDLEKEKDLGGLDAILKDADVRRKINPDEGAADEVHVVSFEGGQIKDVVSIFIDLIGWQSFDKYYFNTAYKLSGVGSGDVIFEVTFNLR